MPKLRHRQVRVAYPNALPGNCRRCGKPGADYRLNLWHRWCWDAYREESNYRGAAERREGKSQRCSVCKRMTGQVVDWNGKRITIKVERDHIVALALNGPHAWTGPRCQICHQDKTTEDNARAKAWRERDPRRSAQRATRGNRRAPMTTTRPRSSAPRNRQAPPPASALSTTLRALAGLALIGAALATAFDWWDELRALASASVPYVVGSGVVLVGALALHLYARWRRAAHLEAIYRLTNAISQEMRVAPDVIQLKVRRWSHHVPVRGRCRYGETVDDKPGSEACEKFEALLEHKLGLKLRFEWEPRRDTVRWRPALPSDPQPDKGTEQSASAPEPDEASGKTQMIQQRVEEKVRSLIKGKAADVDVTWGPADAVGPLRFEVAYHSSYNDESDDTRQALVDGVNSKAPGRWRAVWNTEENRVTFERRPPMPTNIPIPVEASNDTWRLPFGVDEHNEQVVWNMKLHPHALIAGGTGSGKTVTLRALIQAAVARGFVVFIVDPKRIEMAGLRGWPGVRVVATETTHMIALVTVLANVMDQRYTAIEAGTVDDDDLPPVLVVIDEAREFIDRANAHWKANKTGSGPEHPVIERLRSMGRLGRSGRIHLLEGIQRPDAKVIGGEARDNFGFRVALGSMSPEGAKMMFGRTDVGRDIPEDAKGRATVAVSNDIVEVQGYNTPDPRKDRTPGAVALIGKLRALAEEHASNALPQITHAWIEKVAAEFGDKRSSRGRPLLPGEQPTTPAPPAVAAVPDGWEPCRIDELDEGKPALLMIEGEPVEVTIIELVEAVEDADLVEVTYRLADGTEAVIAFEPDEEACRRADG